MDITSIIIGAVIGLVAGGIVVYFMLKNSSEKKGNDIIKKAEADANVVKDRKMLEAKEKFLQLKSDHEKVINERNGKLQSSENRIRQKESTLDKRNKDVERLERDLEGNKKQADRHLEAISQKESELNKLQKQRVEQLENISSMSADNAKEELIKALKDEAKTNSMAYIKDIQEEAKLTANKEARKIVVQTIQRVATEQAVENSVSVFNIASDEIKGRIIGREGRNIRAIEAATGVEIIVDDTPEAIILSCFDPVRREIARLSLHQLVTDGRIHPARIEEVVGKTKKRLQDEIVEIGKRTAIDLGIHGLHPELIRMVGRMKYRSSYGQNLLQHSREVANLCATMSSELGFSEKEIKLAKRAGLLHDIGKVPDDEPEIPHAILGMKIAERYKENKMVCNAIGAHHDEIEMNTMISPIIQVCDAISGARPGARREMADAYIQRLHDLENVALSYEGVNKAFAIQAGRELRVMVESEKVNDEKASELSFNISQKIQEEMTYPGQVKVTVIRETRAVHYAK